MPTKTIRIATEDAQKIMQASREIAYRAECEITPAEVMHELINVCLDEVKERLIFEKKR